MISPQRRATLKVVTLIALLLAAGIWIDLSLLHLTAPSRDSFGSAFLIAVAAFAIAEGVVLHVELGRNAQSVSLAELTLTVSLFFVPFAQLPLARVIGGGLVLLLVRKQRPVKLVFNLSVWVLDCAAATLVFQSLHGSSSTGPVDLILPAVCAGLTASLVDGIAVSLVIALMSGDIDLRRSSRFLLTCLLSALGCAIAGVVCVGALALSSWLLLPVVLLISIYMYGFKRFVTLQTRHTNVAALYEFAAELAHTSSGEDVVRRTLLSVLAPLRAERAVLYLEGADADSVERFALDDQGDLRRLPLARIALPGLVQDSFRSSEAMAARPSDRNVSVRHLLTELDAKDALLAPVRGDQGLLGVLVVLDRLGDVNTFSEDDGLLLQTLAAHSAAALANSRLVQRLNHDSMHDSLTGLANRAWFQRQLVQVLGGQSTNVCVLLMDLDRFKEVNDTLGHHHGDLLLQEIAGRLAAQLRPGDVLARLGGDEFAVLMTGLSVEESTATAERLRGAMAVPTRLQGVEMDVDASVGVVHHLAGAEPLEASVMLQRADVAMYTAKRGYAGIHVYEDELDGYSPRRLALAGGLRAGIEQGQLSLRFQPQARLSDRSIVGVEALVRWEHPVYGEVPPDDFIPIAEQTGQIRELSRWVLNQSLASCASWASAGMPLGVSVNLSVRNLMEADLVPTIEALLKQHGVAASWLTLEITESHLMADPARTIEVLKALSRLGVRISVDDFGTGYSSLAYLKQLPVTEVKVDKSFVLNLANDDDDAAIVEAIIQLAHTLRLDVVAEGVEDDITRQKLTRLSCDRMQGYQLARPMRAADFATWMTENRQTARAAVQVVPTS